MFQAWHTVCSTIAPPWGSRHGREAPNVWRTDGGQAWIAWADDTLLLAAEDFTVFVNGEE